MSSATEKMNKSIAWVLAPSIVIGFIGTIVLAFMDRSDLMMLPIIFNAFVVIAWAVGFMIAVAKDDSINSGKK